MSLISSYCTELLAIMMADANTRNLALYKSCKAAITAISSSNDTWHKQWVNTLLSYFTDKNWIQNFQLQTLCLSSDLSAFFSCECLSVPMIHHNNNLERWSIQMIRYFTTLSVGQTVLTYRFLLFLQQDTLTLILHFCSGTAIPTK